MNDKQVISLINEALHVSTKVLAAWLKKLLCKISDNWWQACVIDKLSYNQYAMVEEKGIKKLDEFDLAALLRITDRNWYALRDIAFLPAVERDTIREMMAVRNNWAHCSGNLPSKESIVHDVVVIIAFLEQRFADKKIIGELEDFKEEIQHTDIISERTSSKDSVLSGNKVDASIKVNSLVYLLSDPNVQGVVLSVGRIGAVEKYQVFTGAGTQTYYTGQIAPVVKEEKFNWIDLPALQSYLSAFEIINPSYGSLYSLNAARIDFVPYQFRPALKLIKSDEPRILIADSVGVGKTIEAGLIIKELEARNDLKRILIICPKPLVAERKWETEMRRFDEEFISIDGNTLRCIINDLKYGSEWAPSYNKAIIPYSILDKRVFEGDNQGRIEMDGLSQLETPPHFDLVIVDEAHHIRNGSMEKEKAFAYKCVKYFCDNADAVVMLTATPLQTSNDDLFTLLNVLRPDVILDKGTFSIMLQPNACISKCVSIIRRAEEGWNIQAQEELNNVLRTQWGENVIAENPLFSSALERLEKEPISREDRVKLITDIEGLNSFSNMINRTRRRDIQDFCVRRSHTVKSDFTDVQRKLHDELLRFEKVALSRLYDVRCVPFMMSMIRRQAASCIFGLAPYLRSIISRKLEQLTDEHDEDYELTAIDKELSFTIEQLAQNVLKLSDALPEEDPKFDSMLEIIRCKQNEENNKIIIFSTFKHTLRYIKNKLNAYKYRVEQIDGSINDEDRCTIRNRFALDRNDDNAIDILLFTEVGSEGLDYQFCNMMINYDLPWNPMRIEQRIGRIDRRGQKSEYVNIYNLITSDTVDADIYERCLMRIGVFERSIGECEEILGEIGSQVGKIAMQSELSDRERREKLEQMADNEVRRIQELSHLEEAEKELFGFDLSGKVMAKEIQDAESDWVTPSNICSLVKMYFNSRLEEGNYIQGEDTLKRLRLSAKFRSVLREDYDKIKKATGISNASWEAYLKGPDPSHSITFDPECASENREAFFITAMHPLAKQAAEYFSIESEKYISINYNSTDIPAGEYAFSIYAWNYVGARQRFRLVTVCENDEISNEIADIVHGGLSGMAYGQEFELRWKALEEKHVNLWLAERQKHSEEEKLSARYRIESLQSNFNNHKRLLEHLIDELLDDNVIRMKRKELENAKEKIEAKIAAVNAKVEQVDIHTTLIVHGVVKVENY